LVKITQSRSRPIASCIFARAFLSVTNSTICSASLSSDLEYRVRVRVRVKAKVRVRVND